MDSLRRLDEYPAGRGVGSGRKRKGIDLVTEQPQRTDAAGVVLRGIEDYLLQSGQVGDDEDVTLAVVVAKARRRGPDGPQGPCRRFYFTPLPVDSDEASGALSVVAEELRSGGATPL